MFCPNCGTNNPDDSMFCENCGSKLEAAAPVVEEPVSGGYVPPHEPAFYSEPAKGGAAKAIVPIVAGIVAVVAVIVIVFSLGIFKHGSVKTIEKMTKATVKGDGKTMYELSVDPYMLEFMLDNDYRDYDDEQDIIDEYNDRAEDVVDELEDEYGDRLKASIEVKKVTKYEKDEIETLAEYLSDQKIYDYPEDALQDVRVIKVRTTIKGSDDEDSETEEMVVCKIDGKWYVSSIFYSKDQIENILDND